ncbi:Alpha/Beta hydrolase protein [Pilaira anomala]|nr:Alpha/Beta hydrolase protein [Pilaira anomala]
MIPDSAFTRGAIYTSAVVQTAVAPFAFFYYVYFIATEHKLFTTYPSIDTFIHYWLGCELMFFIFFQVTRSRMQRLLPSVAPSAKERSDLYSVCLANIDQAETWLPEWFMLSTDSTRHPKFEEVARDNVAEWLSWAFFALPLEDVFQDQTATEELNYMIDNFEQEFHVQFDIGYNEDLIAYRINLDPVHAYHRPLAFYTIIQFLTTLFGFALQFIWGMKKYGPESRSTIWNLMDPQQSYELPLPTEDGPERVSYWFRDGDRTKKPIVFIHGIGAGLMCYLTFIAKLMAIDAPIFCIELPFVSMHCIEDVPTMQETIRDLQNMLHRHEFDDAVFVSHSLGTAVTSWVVKYMSKNVAGVIFLDPICFMLHYKDVCANFVYRTPKTAAQGLVKYFASTELYISYYISRHFHWFQNALYVAPTVPHHNHAYTSSVKMPKNTKVFLSENDNIVDSARVDSYLNHHGIESIVMKDLDHASFLFKPFWQKEILDTIQQYVNQKA